jgi:thiol-disulfide isomerase/thioredoxin
MSMVLYYSNYCEKCKEILPILAQCQAKKDIHFVSIDNRVKKEDNCIYIILENQKELILPPNITKVPALLLLNRGSQVLFGKQILEHIQPRQMAGVMSDNYSFLDQSVDSLSAKGDGGLRQLRNNVTLEYTDNIETPPDDYVPNKVDSGSLEKAKAERDSLISQQQQRQ